jgi:farnesyl diphosphate synthase
MQEVAAMSGDVAFAAWSEACAARAERVLEALLPAASAPPRRLHEAMRYAVLGAGKRMRPLLVYAAAEVAGRGDATQAADRARGAGVTTSAHVEHRADAAAAAVELIHAYSLVHDDLPSMDDDTLRRGKPTCHVAFGEATALLAGDALQALAFEALARGFGTDAGGACALLAQAAGSRGMAGGQAIDLGDGGIESRDELATMHRLKTGALIGASVRLGAMAAGSPSRVVVEALDNYASATGLAFQVVDDVLDVEGSAGALGKTPGKDAAQGKATFVSMLGLAGAKAEAQRLRDAAHAALAPLGPSAQRLCEIADAIVLRRA